MHIRIGDVETLSVEDWTFIPDDRQKKVETVGGVEVQDFGHIEKGDSFSCRVRLREEDAVTVYYYWHNREFVDVEDEGGTVWQDMRVKVKRYTRIKYFPRYYQLELEFWRV